MDGMTDGLHLGEAFRLPPAVVDTPLSETALSEITLYIT